MTVAQSSPTDVHLTFSGGLGTSGYRCGGGGDETERESRNEKREKLAFPRARCRFNQQEFSKSKHVEAHSRKFLADFRRKFPFFWRD